MDPDVDEHSVMTYLSQFPKAKLKPGAPLKPKQLYPKKAKAYGPGEKTRVQTQVPQLWIHLTFKKQSININRSLKTIYLKVHVVDFCYVCCVFRYRASGEYGFKASCIYCGNAGGRTW